MTDIDTSFNGISLSTKYFYTVRIIKPLIPPQEQGIIDIPRTNGAYQSSKKFKNNTITVKGIVTGTSPDDLITNLENLPAYLYFDTDKQLIFNNQSDRYYNAQYLEMFEVLRDGDTSNVDLLFTCNDPFAYDITADTNDTNIVVLDDTYDLSNGGHYYALPVITITFNAIQSHVYVENTTIEDNRFDVSKAFAVNDELEIDCKNGTIKLNGVYSPAGFGDGGDGLAEWIMLAAGNNVIKVGSDDETINVTVNFTFNKTYLY